MIKKNVYGTNPVLYFYFFLSKKDLIVWPRSWKIITKSYLNMQGPVYVGTGCMFRRFALYGFDPPKPDKIVQSTETEMQTLKPNDFDPELDVNHLPKRFGNSTLLAESIPIAEFHGRPLADHSAVKYGRPPGILRAPRDPLDAAAVAEAVSVISCWYACLPFN